METIVVINAGSTSLKWRVSAGEELLGSGSYRDKSTGGVDFSMEWGEGSTGYLGDTSMVGRHLIGVLKKHVAGEVVVLHRIVHGGERYREVTELTGEVVDDLKNLSELAPLHQPVGLAWVRNLQKEFSDWRHFGVFDTTFHSTLEEKDYLYALPRAVSAELGIRRYGFHGISHGDVAGRMQKLKPEAKRIVSVHLGGGVSVCGILEGESKYISMGLTPEEGPVMATRSGTLSVGVVLRLLRSGYGVDEVERMVNRESGLKGLCGTGDMRAVLEGDTEEKRVALSMYVESVAREVAAAVVRLGGVDALVFTGTVGWRSERVRREVVQRLRVLGIEWAGEEREVGPGVRSLGGGVYALEADEERAMVGMYLASRD